MVHWSFIEYDTLRDDYTDLQHEQLANMSAFDLAKALNEVHNQNMFKVIFENMNLIWDSIASDFDILQMTNQASIRYEVFSCFRHVSFDPTMRDLPLVNTVLEMYHIAVDQFIMQFIKTYNTWYTEVCDETSPQNLRSLGAFMRDNLKLEDLKVCGNPEDTTAPAYWLEYKAPASMMGLVTIIQIFVTWFQDGMGRIHDEDVYEVLHKVKKNNLVNIFNFFYPCFYAHSYLFSTEISQEHPQYIPHFLYPLDRPCPSNEHEFVANPLDGNSLICIECNLVRDIDLFDDDELAEYLETEEIEITYVE
jgi:hypothetical protein